MPRIKKARPPQSPSPRPPAARTPTRPPAALQRRPDGEIILVTGGTGSGKTHWVVQHTRHAARLLLWDIKGESARYNAAPVYSIPELVTGCKQTGGGRYAFRPTSPAQFDTFCRLAWIWLQLAPGTLIVEELADVTNPGKAPDAWGEIVRKGRAYGAHVYACTQRPAESDKTILGNVHLVHAGNQAFPRDHKYMAEVLAVPVHQVAALKPLDYIERDFRTLKVRTGRVNL